MPQAKATIKGHPIHPAMVAVPIGLLTGAVLADSAYLLMGQKELWLMVSFWASAAGVVAGLAAAVPGLIDYLFVARHTPAKTIAVVHMVCNVICLVLFGAGSAIIFNHIDRISVYSAITVHFVAFVFLMIGGILGGEMVFRHRLGMVDEAQELPIERTLSAGRK